jgi:hypothetical protein
VADPPVEGQAGPLWRSDPGELISAGCAVLLLVLMFATKWYGVNELPGASSGAGRSTAVDAWHALTLLRWLMLLTIIVALAAPALHLTQRSHGVTTSTGGTVAALGTITALLLIYRVLINLPSSDQVVDQKLGAVLGVLSALGIALGGHGSLRAQRLRARLVQRSRSQRSGVAGQLEPR